MPVVDEIMLPEQGRKSDMVAGSTNNFMGAQFSYNLRQSQIKFSIAVVIFMACAPGKPELNPSTGKKIQNDFMGGPFVSYTFIDRANNKVITLDGYVYHPNEDKKSYIRHLE